MPGITAESVNAWRVFPRVFSVFFLWFMGEVGHWFMALPSPNTEQSAFATGVVAAGAAWFKFYVESGNKV